MKNWESGVEPPHSEGFAEIRGYPLRAFFICLPAYSFSQMDLEDRIV